MTLDADTLLFTDFDGQDASLEDVLSSGLDADVSPRVPGLVHLLEHGEPKHQLYAAMLLLGWGRPEGFAALSRWVASPGDAPWATTLVSWDRFTGEDDSFGQLASALATSRWSDATPALVAMQVQSYRELLSLYTSRFFGRSLADALDCHRAVAALVVPEMIGAIERGLERLRERNSGSLRFQLAALLVALAPHDGAATTRLARSILEGADGRTEREVAFALEKRRGPDHAASRHDPKT